MPNPRSHRFRSGLTCVVSACLLAGVAAAQTPPPVSGPTPVRETVIVTGTAQPVTFETLSREVVVITREEIAALPARSVAEVLRLAASVEVRARGDRGVQSDFAIRGAAFGGALVLVDGVRLNNAQTAHHNGDIPVPLEAIERIEVLMGGGSSLYGADAFGGTVNVITRRAGRVREVTIAGGGFGLVEASGAATIGGGRVRELVSGSTSRADGFMFARDFVTTGVTSQTTVGERTRVLASWQRKDFGANGFYGNSPSHERTNQSLVSVAHRLPDRAGWTLDTVSSYRTHGDRFLWDVRRPGVFENRHRTHALIGTLRASRTFLGGTRASLGGEAGGDWIRSTNLGDHTVARGSGFAEVQRGLGPSAGITGAVRVDRYSTFGAAVSPAAGLYAWVAPAVKLRASAGRVFRVPTFTELYYRDPVHEARSALIPEHAWTGEGGVDWLTGGGWLLASTVFARYDRDVIDWLRATTTDPWQTWNIRSVRTTGIEVSGRRLFGERGFVHVQYTGQRQQAEAVRLLSLYVLDYAPRSFTASGLARMPGGFRVAPRLDYKRRASGVERWVVDLRVSRRVGHAELFIDGSNLLNARDEEVPGVVRAPRWLTAGLRLSAF